MILATALNGEPGWAGAAVAVRALHYTGTLGGAGLAFFALLFGAAQAPTDAARLCRWAGGAALLGILTGLAGLAAQVGIVGGAEGLTDWEIWSVVLASRSGLSYGVGGFGMLLLLPLGLGLRWRLVAAVGGVIACTSFIFVGHTTQLAPRWALAGLLLLHLMVAAFWIGSLLPLAWAAHRGGPQAAGLVERWSRLAAPAVAGLVVAGLLLAWWILGGVRQLVGSWYGWALIAKVALVGVLLGFAALHRWRLAPALAAGTRNAEQRLARSIAAEGMVALLVLYAAAELVSTSPEAHVWAPPDETSQEPAKE